MLCGPMQTGTSSGDKGGPNIRPRKWWHKSVGTDQCIACQKSSRILQSFVCVHFSCRDDLFLGSYCFIKKAGRNFHVGTFKCSHRKSRPWYFAILPQNIMKLVSKTKHEHFLPFVLPHSTWLSWDRCETKENKNGNGTALLRDAVMSYLDPENDGV